MFRREESEVMEGQPQWSDVLKVIGEGWFFNDNYWLERSGLNVIEDEKVSRILEGKGNVVYRKLWLLLVFFSLVDSKVVDKILEDLRKESFSKVIGAVELSEMERVLKEMVEEGSEVEGIREIVRGVVERVVNEKGDLLVGWAAGFWSLVFILREWGESLESGVDYAGYGPDMQAEMVRVIVDLLSREIEQQGGKEELKRLFISNEVFENMRREIEKRLREEGEDGGKEEGREEVERLSPDISFIKAVDDA